MAKSVKNAIRIPSDLLVPRVDLIDGIDRPILAVLGHPRDMARNLGITSEREKPRIPAQLTMSHCRVCNLGGLCVTGDLRPVTDSRCCYVLCRKCDRQYQLSGLKPFEFLMQFLAERDAEAAWMRNHRDYLADEERKAAAAEEARINAPASPGERAWNTFMNRLAIVAGCLSPSFIAVLTPMEPVLKCVVVSPLFLVGLMAAWWFCLYLGKPLEVAPNE